MGGIHNTNSRAIRVGKNFVNKFPDIVNPEPLACKFKTNRRWCVDIVLKKIEGVFSKYGFAFFNCCFCHAQKLSGKFSQKKQWSGKHHQPVEDEIVKII